MHLLALGTLLLSAITTVRAAPTLEGEADVVARDAKHSLEGYDVGYYGNVDWNGFVRNGTKFAYVLATDSTVNKNENFAKNFKAAGDVGLIRGAVHSASPYSSAAAEQVKYFLNNGGKWKKDGKTLPGALSIAFAPSRASCWGFTPDQLKKWIWDFSNGYKQATGLRPVIRTNTNFWTTCLGNPAEFSNSHKLWIVTYQSNVAGPLPAGWNYYTFWQYKDLGTTPSGFPLGNLDKFNGNKAALQRLALGI